MGNDTVRSRQEIPAEDPLAELARLMDQEDEFASLLRPATPARPSASHPSSAPAAPSAPPSRGPAAPSLAPRPGAAPRAPVLPPRPVPARGGVGAARPSSGSFAALAAEVYNEGGNHTPPPRPAPEGLSRDVNRGFARPPAAPEAGQPRVADPRAAEGRPLPEARSLPPRAPDARLPDPRMPQAPVRSPVGGAAADARRAELSPGAAPLARTPAARYAGDASGAGADQSRGGSAGDARLPEFHGRPSGEAAEARLPSWMRREAAPAPEAVAAKPSAPAPRSAAPAPAVGGPVREEVVSKPRDFEPEDDAYDYGHSAAEHAEDRHQSDYDAYEGVDAEDDAALAQGRGRKRLVMVAGAVGVVVIAAAGAYAFLGGSGGSSGPAGEPPVIRADQGPNKIVSSEAGQGQASTDGQKLIYDRVGGSATTGNEQVVSSEEQPVDVSQAAQPRVISTAPVAQTITTTNPSEPKRVRTLTVRADGTIVEDDAPATPLPGGSANIQSSAQPSLSAPVALNSGTGAPVSIDPTPMSATPSIVDNIPAPEPVPAPQQVASAPAPSASSSAGAAAGAYVVQIASVRTEAEAQSTWRSMQAKYPGVLGGQPFSVRRADLGDRGIYYRAQAGSFSNRDGAVRLCEALKAQGGDCMVQRNN